jgi:hypothetical protein
MKHNDSYQSALAASERIGWKVEDLIGGEKQLDFISRSSLSLWCSETASVAVKPRSANRAKR